MRWSPTPRSNRSCASRRRPARSRRNRLKKRWVRRVSCARSPRCARSSAWPTTVSARPIPPSPAPPSCVLSSQAADGGIGDLALGETPEARGRTVAIHFQGWALAALCRSGYDDDARIEKGFRHLLANRQADGGWAWRGVRTDSAARPSSHLVTGMALRAFAASPTRRTSREARRAAELLATRFLQPDRYPDRKAAVLLGAAGRAALLHRRARCAGLRDRGRPRQGELRRAHGGSLRARATESLTACGIPAPRRASGARHQAAAAEREGPRARALADRARADRPPPRQLAPVGVNRGLAAKFRAPQQTCYKDAPCHGTSTPSLRFARSTTCRSRSSSCERSSSIVSTTSAIGGAALLAAVGEDRRLPGGLRLLPAVVALRHRPGPRADDAAAPRCWPPRRAPRTRAPRASAWAPPGARSRTARRSTRCWRWCAACAAWAWRRAARWAC